MQRFSKPLASSVAVLVAAQLWGGVAAAQEEDEAWPIPGDDTPVAEEPLVVAEDPNPEPAPARKAPPPKAVTQPCPVCPTEPAEQRREGVSFSGSLYVLSGVAIDDYHDAGFLVRPSLDLGASFGLGSVSLYVLGSTAAIEYAKFSDRQSTSFPFMFTLGLRADSWTVAAAGGLSAAVDNEYNDINDSEESTISPRGEIKAGYRFENVLEILGHVGVERRTFDNREDTTRILFGLSFGVAGP